MSDKPHLVAKRCAMGRYWVCLPARGLPRMPPWFAVGVTPRQAWERHLSIQAYKRHLHNYDK